MGIVTASHLKARMSGPDWSPEQRRDVEMMLTQLEGALASALNTIISPGTARDERAPISEEGLVVTRHPVAEVLAINGLPVVTKDDGDAVLPRGWVLVDHRIREATHALYGDVTFPHPAIYQSPDMVMGSGLSGMLPGITSRSADAPVHLRYVMVTYRPGWGAAPALQDAILKKAKAMMVNNSTTITARSLEGNKPQPMAEDWSQDELNRLRSFSDVPGPMSTRW